MTLDYQCRGNLVSLQAELQADEVTLTLADGTQKRFRAARNHDSTLTITTADRSFRIPFRQNGAIIEFSYLGRVYEFLPAAGTAARSATQISSGMLTAPMVGTVSEVLVAEGDQVSAYQPLVVIEAMKVLAAIEAPFDGTVRKLHVAKGDQVSHGAPVVEVEPAPRTEESH